MTPPPRTMPSPLTVFHRGFALQIRHSATAFGFVIEHAGLALHRSATDFHTAGAADRAARRFIDDALGSFEVASEALAA